ncbi:hypothetical protein TEA_003618 [Camellia sinensis var. sinensis]|uniref:Transposase Tnp1/En/Spm-like domain-containing protein n=1 Tax=Camellia sinensis var. sinensis TaxID=542762 RepID=A0A4S4E4M2_CAMSN|nr:hypothetical protein TEA_003618 [Camellia sinensis var. sinensis]
MKQGFIKCPPYLPSTPQISCVFIFYDQSSLGFICKAKSLWTHIFSFAQAMLVSLLGQLHLRFSKTLVSPMIMQDEINERTTLNANLSNEGPNDTFGQVIGKEKHGRVRIYGLGVSLSNLWRDTSGHKANQDITMDVMEAKNSELRPKVSHVQHVPNNLTNTSNQVTTASSSLDMATRHQAWSLSSIQDASLTQVGDVVVLKSIIRPTKTVAIRVLKSTDASKEVEGEKLGPDYWKVHVQVPIKPNESLIRSYGLVKTIGQAIGAHVAWPAPFVISQLMDASREYLYK